MSDQPDSLVQAYAFEYRSCKETGQNDRLIVVAEELTKRGWNVNDDGELVKVGEKERADETPPENTAEEAPKRRTSRAKSE